MFLNNPNIVQVLQHYSTRRVEEKWQGEVNKSEKCVTLYYKKGLRFSEEKWQGKVNKSEKCVT